MRKIIIAIDGYSACGKSTTAKAVAKNLGYTFIDSGAMYRAVTHYFQQNHVSLTNASEVEKALDNIDITFRYKKDEDAYETILNSQSIEKEIRTMTVTRLVSQVSALKAVRLALVKQQQKMGKEKGLVMDGRDIGTHVFPDAELKIFMNADKWVRAERRQKELFARGEILDLKEVINSIENRDHLDTTRKESPLVKAEDAWDLDNTTLTMDEQVDVVLRWVDEKVSEINSPLNS